MKVYIKSSASKPSKLYINHGTHLSEYVYKYDTKDGGLYEPVDPDNWYESYIVTPKGTLLTWTLNGKYVPSNYDFWMK